MNHGCKDTREILWGYRLHSRRMIRTEIYQKEQVFSISLGERYLFAFVDIEPDCSALERGFEKDCSNENNQIDHKYAGIINSALKSFIVGQTESLSAFYDKR